LLWSDFLLSYPKSLVEDHLGCTWFGLVGVGLAFALFTAIKNRGKTRSDVGSPSGEVRGAILFAALCLILPLAVLTIFPSRSPVTASVLVGPAIVLALLTIVAFTRRGPAVSTTWQWVALSGLALCIGLYTELSSFSSKGPLAGATNDVKGLAAIYDDIGLQSAQLGWDKPRIAFDRVREYMNSAVLEAWFYERHGVLLDPAPILGHSIMPVNESEALSAISGCDFVVITKPTVDTPGFEYPYNRQMKELYPKLLAATEHSMVPLKNVDAFSQHMTLFVRPTLRLSGQTSDGWITSEGLILSGPSQWVRLRPKIEFAGRIPRLLEQSGNGLGAHAILDVAEKSKEVAATLTQATGEYKLSIQLDPADLPTDGDVQVRVMFDNYFVPSERGLGSDTRRLVIMAPQQIHLFPKD
jgi:hypothetical protein